MTLPVTRPPGLAPERTALAWRRTALSAVVAGVVAGRVALETPVPALALPVGGCLVAGGGLCWLASRRPRVRPTRGSLLAVVSLVQVLGGLGAVALVLV